MLQAELYAIHFANSEPSFYGRIPHIIDHLTYDKVNKKTGKVEKKRLSVYAKELYRVFKSIAGDRGACWQNRDNLADLANMSAGSITNAKNELTQKFHQLDGNPLITITEEKKRNPKNGTEYHKVVILDIWRWNNAFMGTRKFHQEENCNEKTYEQAPSPHDRAREAPSPHDSAPQGAPSPHDINKNPITKTKMFKEQQPVKTPDCSFEKENSVFSDRKNISPEDQAYDWFLKFGCDSKTAAFLSATYSVKDIIDASKYVEDMIDKKRKKRETIGNKIGYLRDALKNKRWIKKGKFDA